jgi:hypothetical protein
VSVTEIKTWRELVHEARNVASPTFIRNLPFLAGNEYRIRFVGDPVEFEMYLVNGKSAITDGGEKCVIRRKYNIEPVVRYAAHAIDRADGFLKIIEVSPLTLRPILEWSMARKRDPGGRSGCDFNIRVRRQNNKNNFIVTSLAITRLTKADLKMIAKEVPGGIEVLSPRLLRIYAAKPQDKIESYLFGN